MTITAMLPSTLPDSVVKDLTQLGAEACHFATEASDAEENFLRICVRMQHFLNSVHNLVSHQTQDGINNGHQMEDAMPTEKKKLLAVVEGTLAYLVSDRGRIEIVPEDTSEIRRCITGVLERVSGDEQEAVSITHERAANIEQQVEKRISARIRIQLAANTLDSLSDEAA